jgi:hypothetical protein
MDSKKEENTWNNKEKLKRGNPPIRRTNRKGQKKGRAYQQKIR